MKTNKEKNNLKSGFTLLELLVVVLIIGILASIALPQYRKAIERSKASQIFPLLKSLGEAGKVYKMTTGKWPSSFDDLDIEKPAWTGTDSLYGNNSNDYSDHISNQDWNLYIQNIADNAVALERLSGPYRGIKFYFGWEMRELLKSPSNQISCIEGTMYTKSAGSYCEKIFGAIKTPYTGLTRLYVMP